MTGDPFELSLSDVVVTRGRFSLGPISLVVEPGSRLVVKGPNGCGKTTLLLAIAGLIPIDGGTIRIGDRVVSSPGHSVEPRARGVGLLQQELGLFPHLTIRRQCELMSGASPDRLQRVADGLAVRELLERKPGALSGGEAQRCALVRTLAVRSRILLLDEPLAAQHETGRARVERVIEAEQADGVSMVIATHMELSGEHTLDL